MKGISRFAIAAVTVLAVSACAFTLPYKPPQGNEPYALLKLKYSYSSVVRGTTLGARLKIRQGGEKESFRMGFNNTFGAIGRRGNRNPRIPINAIKVHVNKPTDVQMAVYFYWYTTQTITTFVNNVPMVQTQQVYHEKACTVQMSFTPHAGKVYLLDYNDPNVNKGCHAQAYQQIKLSAKKFKLKPVGTSKTI